ncbi:MAG: AI-2E family transporter [Anaerolineaceae bacterium]|nr:AI-2E family transporter [Anaerolineaceae bacterium]
MENNLRPAWSIPTKLIVILGILALFGFLFYRFSVALAPLIIAIILAYVLSPIAGFFGRELKLPRGASILLAYVLLLLLIAGALMILIPLLVRQASGFNLNILHWLEQGRNLFNDKIVIAGVVIDGPTLLGQIVSQLEGLLRPVFGTTLDVVAALLGWLVWIVFIFIISIYLVKDSGKIMAWFQSLVPPAYRSDFDHLVEDVNTIWSAFFRGQLLLALIVTLIITLEGLILGLPFAFLMGLLAGLMEFLPSIGHGIWLVIASLLALFMGSAHLPIPNWAFFLVVLGVHIIFTQFDLNYLIPRVIGRSVQLPPMVVILGIVAGAAIAGVLGVVLAAPSIASLRVILRYLYARLLDQEPFAVESPAPRLPPPKLQWWKKGGSRKTKPSL